jgi:hypothetical protein
MSSNDLIPDNNNSLIHDVTLFPNIPPDLISNTDEDQTLGLLTAIDATKSYDYNCRMKSFQCDRCNHNYGINRMELTYEVQNLLKDGGISNYNGQLIILRGFTNFLVDFDEICLYPYVIREKNRLILDGSSTLTLNNYNIRLISLLITYLNVFFLHVDICLLDENESKDPISLLYDMNTEITHTALQNALDKTRNFAVNYYYTRFGVSPTTTVEDRDGITFYKCDHCSYLHNFRELVMTGDIRDIIRLRGSQSYSNIFRVLVAFYCFGDVADITMLHGYATMKKGKLYCTMSTMSDNTMIGSFAIVNILIEHFNKLVGHARRCTDTRL